MMCRAVISMLLLLLLLSGCKADEGADDEASLSHSQKPIVDLQVKGRVSLGAKEGAEVQVYPILAGEVDFEQVLASAVTDRSGQFELVVAHKYNREPVLIEVSFANASVDCVSLAGCGSGREFLASLPSGSSIVRLHLVVPNLSAAVDYQVSLLSEIASAAALADLHNLEQASVNGSSNLEARFLITKANTRVASRFGLMSYLPGSPVADITQVDQVLAGRSAALTNASLESALLSQCLVRALEPTLQSAIDYCNAQYVERGIPELSSRSDAVLSMLQVVDDVLKVHKYIQSLGRDFAVERSEVIAQRGVLLAQQPDDYSKGNASSNANLPLVEQGKQFVENVRQIASSLDLTKIVALSDLSSFVSGETAVALEDVGVQVDLENAVSGKQLNRTFKVFQVAMGAVFDLVLSYYTDQELPSRVDGADILHQVLGAEHHIKVIGSIRACTDGDADISCVAQVDLSFTIGLEKFRANAVSQSIFAESMALTVSGNVELEDYTFTLPGNLLPIYLLEPSVSVKSHGDEVQSVAIDFLSAKADIPFAIATQDAAESTLISGHAHLSSDYASFGYSANEIALEDGILEETQVFNIIALENFGASLSGAIQTSQGANFFASLNVLQNQIPFIGNVTFTERTQKYCRSTADCAHISSESEFTGESDDSFIGLTASIAYKADLRGVSEPVLIGISGYRTSPTETAINSLKVTYPGHALSLNGQFNQKGGITSMNATNLDGMEMFIKTGDGGKRYGAVSGPGGDKVGEVIDMGEWIMIRYPDGNFVSM